MKKPTWVGLCGIVGLFWNALLLFHALGAVGRSEADFLAQGDSAVAALALAAVPVWAEVGLLAGAVTGIAGCILIARRDRRAVIWLVVSLLALGLRVVGNAVTGVFALTGPGHAGVNGLMLAIAAALVAVAVAGRRHRILT